MELRSMATSSRLSLRRARLLRRGPRAPFALPLGGVYALRLRCCPLRRVSRLRPLATCVALALPPARLRPRVALRACVSAAAGDFVSRSRRRPPARDHVSRFVLARRSLRWRTTADLSAKVLVGPYAPCAARSMATMSRRTAWVRSLDWRLRFRHPLSHGCVCLCVCAFPVLRARLLDLRCPRLHELHEKKEIDAIRLMQ